MSSSVTSPNSPYPREDYFGEDDDDTEIAQRDEDLNRDWGVHHQFRDENDRNAIIAHRFLRESATMLCAETLFGSPNNGGRTAELCAWLFDGECIDGRAWAMHHENCEIELTDPELHLGRTGSEEFGTQEYGQFRHRRRFNPLTGYITNGETTSVFIQDRPLEEFLDVVGTAIEIYDPRTPTADEVLARATRLKRKGESRDVDIMERVVRWLREPWTLDEDAIV